LRHKKQLLFDLKIKNEKAQNHYELDAGPLSSYIEYIAESVYKKLPPEVKANTKDASLFKYLDNNPKEKKPVKILLCGQPNQQQKFYIVSNYAPFCKNHFVIYAANEGNKALKQMYHNDTLFWIDSLYSQIGSGDYRLFFNRKGAGNSVDTLHFQFLKSPFPVFDYLGKKFTNFKPALIETNRKDWPFTGILARYNSSSKEEILTSLHHKILDWFSADCENTFNLLFQQAPGGYREFFFIFRKKGYNYISGIKNAIAGYEAGGNIIVENEADYNGFPSATDRLELENHQN
jgi:hypothetical protein